MLRYLLTSACVLCLFCRCLTYLQGPTGVTKRTPQFRQFVPRDRRSSPNSTRVDGFDVFALALLVQKLLNSLPTESIDLFFLDDDVITHTVFVVWQDHPSEGADGSPEDSDDTLRKYRRYCSYSPDSRCVKAPLSLCRYCVADFGKCRPAPSRSLGGQPAHYCPLQLVQPSFGSPAGSQATPVVPSPSDH